MVRLQTRTLISSLVALVGTWLIVRQAPDFLAALLIMVTDMEQFPLSILKLQAIHFSINLLLGLILILLRNKIACWLVPNESNVKVLFRLFCAVGSALMGIYFIGLGFISLGESLGSQDAKFGSNPYLYWRGLFSLVIGGILFLGSVGISKLWALLSKLRHAGL